MGRLLGIASCAAFAMTLLCCVADASTIPASPIDLRSQFMLQLFGETNDVGASVAAAYGDRSSESPLRELVLGAAKHPEVVAYAAGSSFVPTFAVIVAQRTPDARLFAAAAQKSALNAAAFVPTAQPVSPDLKQAGSAAARLGAGDSYAMGTYQPEAPQAVISPEPGTLSFQPLGTEQTAEQHQDDLLSAAASAPDAQRSAGSISQTLHVGPESFQGRTQGTQVQSQAASIDDASYGAGANFDVRAGARKLNVDVSSSYEHLLRNDASSFSSSNLGGTGWQLPGDNVPLAVPNYADVSKLAVGANVAVPVFKGLTLNLNYDAARMLGGYGLPGVTNLDAIDNSYGGGLTLSIPRFSSTLSVSAQQQHYQDNIAPLNTS
ncbi:MAG: hypothetical protein JO199_05900, partial [Candidatus Eremiobacteraeota bacterium]|nr:hypothetical protein [Candidatus Eremiobacteraeota bacterium]